MEDIGMDKNRMGAEAFEGLREFVSQIIVELESEAAETDEVHLGVIAESFFNELDAFVTSERICFEANLDARGQLLASRGLRAQYVRLMENLRLGLMGVQALTSDAQLAEDLESVTGVIMDTLIAPMAAA